MGEAEQGDLAVDLESAIEEATEEATEVVLEGMEAEVGVGTEEGPEGTEEGMEADLGVGTEEGPEGTEEGMETEVGWVQRRGRRTAGLKHHSTAFHFKTSVPAASSSHGALLAVVPGVLGLMAFSPETDSRGNPWRALHFCQELVSRFQLHSFDIRTPFRQVLAYRQWKSESEGYQIMNLLLAAFKGDVQSLRRYFLSGVDVNSVDYDGRSALHVAAAEGHVEVIRFLLENTGANPQLRDRWGSSPLHEARRHNRDAAVQILQTTSTPDSSSPLSS
ncbi:glutaminase liver isoform, mitochondrial-like [Boleophthalmus pectinirostris]|uniref:glutaminase liver isoform, mitochondrial-like n=1 Tax=Boleophthalmus pectinirostris TaxID=150288 RepID=UPI002432FAE8|nr:glutaminase liver isoform, mitochondrial-like [Boleophthalmus pectinirostris]